MKTLLTGVATLFIILFTLIVSPATHATGNPHGLDNGYSCSVCHATHISLGTSGYNNVCLNCHRPGVPKAENKPFTLADAARPFASSANQRTYQSSHQWSGFDSMTAAGALPPLAPELQRQKMLNQLACARCHDLHTSKGEPLLRLNNDRDQLCLDCHRSRNTSSHVTGSHPVGVNYTGASSKYALNPARFNNPPLSANPANPTASLRLKENQVFCTTCHGVHYADSNSATFDNATSYYSLQPSQGHLLRTDLKGKTATAINICSNCHVKKNHSNKGQNIQCADCHAGHVDYMPDAVTAEEKVPNAYLVRRYLTISTASGPVRKTVFMQRSSSARKYVDNGKGVCEVCHAVPSSIAAHTTVDTTAAYCGNCHSHNNVNGAFSASGGACDACHGHDQASSRPLTTGRHASHINTVTNPALGKPFGCVECHAKTVSGNFTISNPANHANGFKDYSGLRAGRSANCTSFYCHSNGKGTFANPPAWTSGATLDCNGCHGTGNSTGAPDYASGAAGSSTANSHAKHVKSGSASCDTCHTDTTTTGTVIKAGSALHANGTIDVTFNSSKVTATWTAGTKSCSNISCHAGGSAQWGGTLSCTGCHGGPARSGNPMATGAHGAHVNNAAVIGIDFNCDACHAPTISGNAVIVTPVNHANGMVDYSGARAGRNKSCASFYCHSNGKGISANPPAWNSGTHLGCNGCHGTGNGYGYPDYVSGPAGSATANSHVRHTAAGAASCNTCHDDTTATGLAIKAGSNSHINNSIDVSFNAAKAGASASWNPGTKSCTNVYCHSASIPVWGATMATDCTGCHGNDAQSPFPIATGKHDRHMNNYTTLGRGNNFACVECHASTVVDNRTINSQGNHVNGMKNYSGAKTGRIASAGSGKCSTGYCHSTGMKENLFWNMTGANWNSARIFSCNGCHGTLQLPDGAFAAFTSVAGEPSYSNGGAGTATANSHQRHVAGAGMTDSTACSRCHRTTVDPSMANKLRDYSTAHLNKSRDVVFSAAIQGRYSATTQQCLNVYCHSNGLPFDNSTTIYKAPVWGDAALTCASCHADPATADKLSGRHAKHTASTIYVSSCDRCHYNTVDATGKIIAKTKHANGTKDIAFSNGGSYNSTTKDCTTYCHSDARGGNPTTGVKWSDKNVSMKCYSCHKGQTTATSPDNTAANCADIQGAWSSAKNYCTPDLTMSSNGHHRLVGPQWIRKYPCYYCHNNTIDTNGTLKDPSKHLNGTKDVAMAPQWNIVGRDDPSYDPNTKICDNVYCHSDGTSNPDKVKPFAWTEPKTECNSCHGHPNGTCNNAGCHDGRTDGDGKIWTQIPGGGWPAGQEWKASIPMFKNEGPGTARANSHPRHIQTDFTCDQCHAATINAGACTTCHKTGIPPGGMGEVSHINAAYHVNRAKDVVFRNNSGSYDPISKKCSNTACHVGYEPVWGGSVNDAVTCLNCHGTTGGDVDDFNPTNGNRGKINLTEWYGAGHGRYSTSGRYPVSNNPAANFGSNPCWYCHDNNVLHNYTGNPFRLRKHPQFTKRFEKECVYCHMEKSDTECRSCHNSIESLAPQLANITSVRFSHNHGAYATDATSCIAVCHTADDSIHKSGSRFWTQHEKEDVKNQYMMMGVCLQCHDDDSNNQCTSCHTAPVDNPTKYSIGFNPNLSGTRFIKPKKARASSGHFGYKHFRAYEKDGVWKGGKFCWDCHDPHGDNNIYMIQREVATTTDGTHGKPLSRATVVFTKKVSGKDYANSDSTKPYNGICNVCHSRENNKHYLKDGGDRHNESRPCTTCHEHRFADSHANKQACDSCHTNKKPVPKHAAFSLPRDCTKCHAGIIGNRMDIMTQLKSNSHHIQVADPKDINNKHCYACHWEATVEGLIDTQYHEGYNYKTYTSVKNAKVDLVVWKPGVRPTYYNTTTAVSFLAKNIGTVNERGEAAKVTNHCLGCHSDQNNDTMPFEKDCKTPRQYAWDYQSIGARYSQKGTTTWGKYPATANAAKKNITKSFSAHGNAAANAGGWDKTTGVDGTIPNRRAGAVNVECFDCHSSHGSSLVGTTSSYLTFNNTKNGANLKETQAGKGGYSMTYKAAANTTPGAVNPYKAGAAQCFDCHTTRDAGTTPWGYYSTFGAVSSVKGYMDSDKFGGGPNGPMARSPLKANMAPIKGGHLKASSSLTTSAQGTIDGLCTPCHDPHGVSPILGNNQAYAVPLLKGTWMTSPYKEDGPPADPYGPTANGIRWGATRAHPAVAPESNYNIDRNTFGASSRISEDDSKFAGLCLSCHLKNALTDGTNKNQSWKSIDRIHETVKGWGANTEHSYSCSKCHTPHTSGLPRLMVTNCLDYKHRGKKTSGGQVALGVTSESEYRGYPIANVLGNSASTQASNSCHVGAPMNSGSWPDKNLWNVKTPW